ncbi:RAB GTPase homolog A1G [Actinidia rufa]|uniref:RAB GTPase homolog A1G n=1 Tax=Actinidia rufa TaxID=165716 RepID=A0A7J0EST6_9ERIC|nr:RAB GTPase homolog A1G [Actinidia rufa]
MARRADEEYDYLFKVVLIGDSGVGKSNLLSPIHPKRVLPRIQIHHRRRIRHPHSRDFSIAIVLIGLRIVLSQLPLLNWITCRV